jgi:hypothetical protein
MHSLGVLHGPTFGINSLCTFFRIVKIKLGQGVGRVRFFFTSAFPIKPDPQWDGKLPPIIIPFVLLSLLSNLLGLSKSFNRKTGVLRVLHERQEPPRG